MRHRQRAVTIKEEKDDYLILENEVLISKEDSSLIPFISLRTDYNGYARMKGNGSDEWNYGTYLHRVIATRMGLDTSRHIDHINNKRNDNCRTNLQAISARNNTTKEIKSKSKYHRVGWNSESRKWRVVFYVDQRKQEYFGAYKDEVEAAYWSDVWAVRLLTADVLLNFPDNINFYLEEALLLKCNLPWKRDIPTLEKLYA